MTFEGLLTQVLNGLTIGAILMLIAMGLTVIFGLMGVVSALNALPRNVWGDVLISLVTIGMTLPGTKRQIRTGIEDEFSVKYRKRYR